MVTIPNMMGLLQLAVSNPDAAAQVFAASGAPPPALSAGAGADANTIPIAPQSNTAAKGDRLSPQVSNAAMKGNFGGAAAQSQVAAALPAPMNILPALAQAPMPAQAPAQAPAPAQNPASNLAGVLSGVQAPPQSAGISPPGAVSPPGGRALNPAFLQMIAQLMQGTAATAPTALGGLIRGR